MCRRNFKVPVTAVYLLLAVLSHSVYAGLSDRVVAFVDDQAITLSEFRDQLTAVRSVSPDARPEDVINTMINRKILIREARKYRLEAPSDEELVNEYIDLKVRAYIRVGEPDIEEFYEKNIEQFPDKRYEDVREEIEMYLTEKQLNEKLRETLKTLRETSFIKIQLGPE